MGDLADLTLTEAAAAIADRRVSPVELVDAAAQRIAAVEDRVHAFAELDLEGARAAASELAEELLHGEPRGPLHGIPLGIKDVMDVEGLLTRAGSDVLDPTPAPEDAPAVASLRGAGGVILGKTTTHEFAFGCETPPTRNPWNLEHIPGGSSGGSGAAVAAGECLGALGTDSGGSVRIPAALCGITGLRPRRGRVSLDRTIPFSWTHDTVGPLARTAADVALLWSTLTGDPVPEPAEVANLRIAAPADVRALGEIDADVVAGCEQALSVLVEAGATRVSVELPPYATWDRDRFTVVLSDLLAAHTDAGWYPDRLDRYSAELQSYFARAETIRGGDLVLARRRLDELARRFGAALDEADVLVLPTVALPAPRAEAQPERERTGPQGISSTTVELIRTCAPVSYCGLAAVSAPCGLSSSGLPIGLQVIAREEATALAVALAFQLRTDHHTARPSPW